MTSIDASALLAEVDDWLSRSRIPEAIKRGVIRRQRTGLGGSHTVVTYPPLDVLPPINSSDLLQAATTIPALHLYVHFAFCEHICHFCHYETERLAIGAENAATEDYFAALCDELSYWAELLGPGSRLSSVYLGGGTPTAASLGRLAEVVDALSAFTWLDGARFCAEVSPKTIMDRRGKEKLRFLIDSGVDRFSIGVQSFDDDLLKATRGHGRQTAIQAVERLLHTDTELNVDLIQDLNGQTEDAIVSDVEAIARLRPHQVTWYTQRLHERSAWHTLYALGRLPTVDENESVRRRLLIRVAMRAIGYLPRSGGRFVRSEDLVDTFKNVRAGTDQALIGTGVSAYSHAWGYFFRNTSRTGFQRTARREYIAAVASSRLAVATGLRLDKTEQAASRVVSGIRHGVSLAGAQAPAAYLRHATEVLDRLAAYDLVTEEAGVYELTEAGRLFEEEICASLYSPWTLEQPELVTGNRERQQYARIAEAAKAETATR